MKIHLPIIPIVFEITARRRTEPFRFRMRPFMAAVGLVALIVYLFLPLSAADQRLMAAYEQLGNTDPKPDLTRAQVIGKIGSPATCVIPTTPNTCTDFTWVARFETPLSYQELQLNLAIDPKTDLVAAWGLQKNEYRGLDLILFRIGQALAYIGV